MRVRRKITPRQEKALAALLAEPTHAAAAARAQVSEATLYRWLKQPAFQAAYRELRRRAVDGAVSHLQQATAEAVETLRRGLSCGQPVAEVRAARIGTEQAWIVGTFNLGAFVALFFSTQFADRNFAAERFLGFSHVIGGLAILGLFFIRRGAGEPSAPFWPFFLLLLVHSLFYVPTIS